MLEVSIILNSASGKSRRSLGTLKIVNDLTGTNKTGHYQYELLSGHALDHDDTMYIAKKGTVKHRRELGALRLIEKVLKDINREKTNS